MPIIKNKFISTFIGTFFVYFGVCFILPISSFSVYITSYIHLKQEFVTMHYGLFLNLIIRISSSISNPLAGILEHKIGFLFTIYTGFITMFIGNIIFIFQQNIWLSFFVFILMGLGDGIATSLLIKNLTFYHPNKKGVIAGICRLLSSILGVIFNLAGEKIIAFKGYTLKEHEEYYPKEIAERYKIYFIIASFLLPIGLILSTILIYEYKPEFSEKNENNSINDENKEKQENNKNNQVSSNQNDDKFKFDPGYFYQKQLKIKSKKNVKKALKCLRFWKINLFFFCLQFSFAFILDTGRIIGSLFGIDGTTLQYLAIIQTLSSIIVVPILGILSDKKGPLFILRIASIILLISPAILAFLMKNTFCFIISLIFNKIGLSGLLVSFGPLVMEIFGIQESAILGGIIIVFGKLGEVITTVIGFVVSFYYKKVELYIPYRIIYIICIFTCFMSIILIFLEKKDKFNYNNDKDDKTI